MIDTGMEMAIDLTDSIMDEGVVGAVTAGAAIIGVIGAAYMARKNKGTEHDPDAANNKFEKTVRTELINAVKIKNKNAPKNAVTSIPALVTVGCSDNEIKDFCAKSVSNGKFFSHFISEWRELAENEAKRSSYNIDAAISELEPFTKSDCCIVYDNGGDDELITSVIFYSKKNNKFYQVSINKSDRPISIVDPKYIMKQLDKEKQYSRGSMQPASKIYKTIYNELRSGSVNEAFGLFNKKKSDSVSVYDQVAQAAVAIKNGTAGKSVLKYNYTLFLVTDCTEDDIINFWTKYSEKDPEFMKRLESYYDTADVSDDMARRREECKKAFREIAKKPYLILNNNRNYTVMEFFTASDKKIYHINFNPDARYTVDSDPAKPYLQAMRRFVSARPTPDHKEVQKAYQNVRVNEAFSIDPENDIQTINETVAKRDLFYRLSESEMFQNANRMAKINGESVVDVLPRMAVEGQGFSHVELSELDPTVIYELFESNRFRITCKRAMRNLLNSGKVVMVYGDTYRIPTCIPYIVASSGNRVTVYVNITPFTGINKYGKIVVNQMRNYSGLMAVLFAACVAHEVAEKTRTLPTELLDALVLFYSGMLAKVINGVVHADSIQKETCKYLCAEFALVQMYGTEYGTTLFQRIKNKYFPKLGNLIINSIDDTFNIDGFDNMTSFVEELKSRYPIMKVLSTSIISERWMKSFGSATALSLDYLGYHLYTLCMLLFESPLVSRMALEPLIDQKKGTEAFKRMQTIISE